MNQLVRLFDINNIILYYIEVYEKNAQTEPGIKITHFQFHYDNLEIS